MEKVKRKWDMLSEEKRKDAIEVIIKFFKDERDEEIGIIAAENLLDLFLEMIAKDVYNKGVDDAKIALKKRFDDLEFDLDVLLRK
jgi:uncharacterized protein (DUF2164 family)